MPRIRYLKPDFFTDEDLAELPIQTRLTFAGLWCHADKAGRLEDRPRYFKAMIFPYDDGIDMDHELELLTQPKRSGKPFIVRYEAQSTKIIQILSWEKHQRPHHTERDSIFPPAPPLTEKRMGIGMGMEKQLNPSTELRNGEITVKKPLFRGNGEGEKEKKPVASLPAPHSQDDVEAVVMHWNKICGGVLTKVQKITKPRETTIRARLKEYPLSEWPNIFSTIMQTPFLLGENDRGWKADFDFVMSKSKFTKILEGSYRGSGSSKKKDTFTNSMEVIKRAASEEQFPHNQLGEEDQEINVTLGNGTGNVPVLPDHQPKGESDPGDIHPANGDELDHPQATEAAERPPGEEVLPEEDRRQIYKKGVSQLLEVLNNKRPADGDQPEDSAAPTVAKGPTLEESLSRGTAGGESEEIEF